MTSKEEKEIVEKLKAQRANVRPSRDLLTSILAQLPSEPKREWNQYFWWLRIAIPAGVAVLVGVVFLQIQEDPSPIAQTPASPEVSLRQLAGQETQMLSASPLTMEEEMIEQVSERHESFFEGASLIEEAKLSNGDPRKDKVFAQIDLIEQGVLETTSSRAALIQENLAELSGSGANVQELETLLADTQTKIREASGLLNSLKKEVRSKEVNPALIHDVHDTLKGVTNTVRGAYKTFRSIDRETGNLPQSGRIKK